MAGKGGNRRLLIGTDTDRLAAVAAIFGRQDELFLILVVIAFRPAVIGALLQLEEFLGGELDTLLDRVELGPILR
jgi:hypothetical protein